MGQKNVFYDILEGKNASLDYKNKRLEKSKNWDFSKWLVYGFGEKSAAFFLLFVSAKEAGKMCLRYF